MTIQFEKIGSGKWFIARPNFPASSKGQACGNIFRPTDNTGGKWRICFASCDGDTAHLQGKVLDFGTEAAAKHHLDSIFMHW